MAQVTVVCGPPGSGKSTYVKNRAKSGDLILDIDTIWQALSGRPYYEKPSALMSYVLDTWESLIDRVDEVESYHAWIVSSLPLAVDRQRYADRFNDADIETQIILLDVNEYDCMDRIAKDERRAKHVEGWKPIVRRWFDAYEPRIQ
ncbi:hypothetical protein LCGC14_2809800, partial [marine sediment metagenome]